MSKAMILPCQDVDVQGPDLLLLQEFGLAELCSTDLQHLQVLLCDSDMQ